MPGEPRSRWARAVTQHPLQPVGRLGGGKEDRETPEDGLAQEKPRTLSSLRKMGASATPPVLGERESPPEWGCREGGGDRERVAAPAGVEAGRLFHLWPVRRKERHSGHFLPTLQ